jgi:hypothetical protein
MAIITYLGDKYLIFINGDTVRYQLSVAGDRTSYNDNVWNREEYSLEEDWINRLEELGVVDEELGIGLTSP